MSGQQPEIGKVPTSPIVLLKVPGRFCGCVAGGRETALSLTPQDAVREEYPIWKNIPGWDVEGTFVVSTRAIICCNCKQEGAPTHQFVFQKIPRLSVDPPTTIGDLNTWHMAAVTPLVNTGVKRPAP